MNSSEILQEIQNCASFNEQGKFTESYEKQICLIEKIKKTNFYPILKNILDIYYQTCSALYKNNECIICNFVKLNPVIRYDKNQMEKSLGELEKHMKGAEEIKIDLQGTLMSLFPFDISVEYKNEDVVVGFDSVLHVEVKSYIDFDIAIDSIFVAFEDNGSKIVEINVKDNILLKKKGIYKFDYEKKVHLGLQKEKISYILLKFGNLIIKIQKDFQSELRVLPDSSKCLVEYEMNTKCLTGAKIPITVKISADDQKLINIKASVIHDLIGMNFQICCLYNNKSYLNEPIEINEIEPGESTSFILYVKSEVDISTFLNLEITFETNSYNNGIVKKEIPFFCQSPIYYKHVLYDDNFQIIQDNPNIDFDSFVLLESKLTNVIDSNIYITNIEISPEVSSDELEFPIELLPNETFTFMIKIEDDQEHIMKILYKTKDLDSLINIACPNIKKGKDNIKFEIEYPSSAVRGKEFEVRIILERLRDNGLDNGALNLTIEKSASFLINGPLQKKILIFEGQKRIIPIKLIPVDVGSLILPTVYINDTSTTMNPKKCITPIIVTYK